MIFISIGWSFKGAEEELNNHRYDIHMQNKPFKVLYRFEWWWLVLSNWNEDLFPYIPNSSFDSGSIESAVRRWIGCNVGEILNYIEKRLSSIEFFDRTYPSVLEFCQ